MAIEKGYSPYRSRSRNIKNSWTKPRNKLSRNAQVNTFPFSWLESQDKSWNDDQEKISCLDETLKIIMNLLFRIYILGLLASEILIQKWRKSEKN